MCPTWSRVADEIESLARDRALAASVEPDYRERELLAREAGLLEVAARFARSGPGDGFLVHTACEGVIVHRDTFVLWGISDTGEQGLRAFAADWSVRVDRIAPYRVLAAVLGAPEQPIAQVASAA